MSPISPYLLPPIMLVALLTMAGMARLLKIRPADGHFAAIDGLRGYLAFSVFLCHSCVWYFYLHGYGWKPPPSNLFNHCGSTSVCLFFMITAFLFFNKLLQARGKGMDWLKLYVSRLLRIMPLYGAAMLLLFCIIAILTRGKLYTPIEDIIWGILKWLVFIQTDLNGVPGTWRVVAGVVWSLAFEWMFYFSLPFLRLFLEIRVSLKALLFALIGLIFFILIIYIFYPVGGFMRVVPFLSGMLAAVVTRSKKAKKWARGPVISFVIALLLVLTIAFFPDVYSPLPLLFITGAFIAIACGNTVFGILSHPLSRIFGQISYSIYLLHGITLFVTFTWIVGFKRAFTFTPLEHWTTILCCGVGVVAISSLTYKLIEKPSLDAAPTVANWLRKTTERTKTSQLS